MRNTPNYSSAASATKSLETDKSWKLITELIQGRNHSSATFVRKYFQSAALLENTYLLMVLGNINVIIVTNVLLEKTICVSMLNQMFVYDLVNKYLFAAASIALNF